MKKKKKQKMSMHTHTHTMYTAEVYTAAVDHADTAHVIRAATEEYTRAKKYNGTIKEIALARDTIDTMFTEVVAKEREEVAVAAEKQQQENNFIEIEKKKRIVTDLTRERDRKKEEGKNTEEMDQRLHKAKEAYTAAITQ